MLYNTHQPAKMNKTEKNIKLKIDSKLLKRPSQCQIMVEIRNYFAITVLTTGNKMHGGQKQIISFNWIFLSLAPSSMLLVISLIEKSLQLDNL